MTYRTSGRRCISNSVFLVFLLGGIGPFFAQVGFAQADSPSAESLDRVWVQPPPSTGQTASWYPPAVRSVKGKILRFDSAQLEIVAQGASSASRLASERVLWIQPAGFELLEGPMAELYRKGDFADTLSKLPATLEQRPSIWRQQWITMLAANAAWKSRRSKIALDLVSQLDRRSLPPLAVAWLPIAWQRGVQSSEAIRDAEPRLSDPSEAVRLVAASWLLSSAKRNQAVAVLKQLVTSDRKEISSLAGPLLWRIASPPEIQRLARQWEQQLAELPMVFQPGPTRALADQLEAAGMAADAKRLRWATELTPIHPSFGDLDTQSW